MTKQIESILHKEMSRKEFLATLGFGVASIFGFSTIIHLLTGKSLSTELRRHELGYGESPYGGGRE